MTTAYNPWSVTAWKKQEEIYKALDAIRRCKSAPDRRTHVGRVRIATAVYHLKKLNATR